jgi:catechol 2,3-dioxygenase-like lactoylglutathione lyase family enzyme
VPISFDLVTFDSPDTDRAARFWGAALGLVESQREDGDRWIVLSDRAGTRRIGVQKGPARPGTVHLDLACTPAEFTDEMRRLLALGAVQAIAPRRELYGSIVNLLDPDGNPFDLCAYLDW